MLKVIFGIAALAQAQQSDSCPAIDMSQSTLDKKRLQGDWYTASYFSLTPSDVACRHINYFYDSLNDQLYRASEATVNDELFLNAHEPSDLETSWGTDENP